MKFKLIALAAAFALALFSTGCSTINNTPVLGSLVPDLTNPQELEDTAELAAALICEKNPDKADDILKAALQAEQALSGEVISRVQFDRWVDGMLARNVDSPTLRVFIRQRFDAAWAANSPSIDITGLILKNAKHLELAKAFVAGLRKGAGAVADPGRA
jgi:hypothetical protein